MSAPASYSLSPRALRLALWLKILLVVFAVYFCARYLAVECGTRRPIDFDVYYHAASLLRSGANPYIGTNYVYPLSFAALMIPLSCLPLVWAEAIWRLINLSLIVLGTAAAVICVRRAGIRAGQNDAPPGPLARLGIAPIAAACMILASKPVMHTVILGQANLLIIAALAGALYFGAQGRRTWSGAAFALAVLIKGQPLLLLPALLPALGLAGFLTAAGIGLVYVLILCLSGSWQWQWQLLAVKAPLEAGSPRDSFSLFYVFSHLSPDKQWAPSLALTAQAVLFLVMIGGAFWMWRRRAAAHWIAAYGIACYLPLSPMLETHHLAVLSLTGILLLAAAEAKGAAAESKGAAARRAWLEPLICAILPLIMANLGMVLFDLRAKLLPAAVVLFYVGLAVSAWGALRQGLRP